MSNFRLLLLLTAVAGFLVWLTSLPVEQKQITAQNFNGAAAHMMSIERVYQGFQR